MLKRFSIIEHCEFCVDIKFLQDNTHYMYQQKVIYNLTFYFPTKTLSMYLRAGSGRSLAMCHVVLGGFNTRFTIKVFVPFTLT